MIRHLPRLLLTGALLSPMTLYALGLGEIRLNSALNQPFDAEIELLSPTPEELSSLKVSMAGQDVFSRYGIDRPGYLSSFDFMVSRGRDGKATIKVRVALETFNAYSVPLERSPHRSGTNLKMDPRGSSWMP